MRHCRFAGWCRRKWESSNNLKKWINVQKAVNRQLWEDRDSRESSLNTENTVKNARLTCQATESHSIFKKMMKFKNTERKKCLCKSKKSTRKRINKNEKTQKSTKWVLQNNTSEKERMLKEVYKEIRKKVE